MAKNNLLVIVTHELLRVSKLWLSQTKIISLLGLPGLLMNGSPWDLVARHCLATLRNSYCARPRKKAGDPEHRSPRTVYRGSSASYCSLWLSVAALLVLIGVFVGSVLCCSRQSSGSMLFLCFSHFDCYIVSLQFCLLSPSPLSAGSADSGSESRGIFFVNCMGRDKEVPEPRA